MNPIGPAERRRHAALLGLLLLAFLFRVIAQLVQAWRPVAWLPPFEAWHSATLPYPALVAAQFTIIAVALWCIVGLVQGDVRPNLRLGQVLQILGWVYLMVMALRLVLGLTVLHRIRWFDAPLPSLFHLVLASMVLTLASFHRRGGGPIPRG
jgi:hypothetical protein